MHHFIYHLRLKRVEFQYQLNFRCITVIIKSNKHIQQMCALTKIDGDTFSTASGLVIVFPQRFIFTSLNVNLANRASVWTGTDINVRPWQRSWDEGFWRGVKMNEHDNVTHINSSHSHSVALPGIPTVMRIDTFFCKWNCGV